MSPKQARWPYELPREQGDATQERDQQATGGGGGVAAGAYSGSGRGAQHRQQAQKRGVSHAGRVSQADLSAVQIGL